MKLSEYICNNVQARKIVIILKVEIVTAEADKIGEPIPIEKANSAPIATVQYHSSGLTTDQAQGPQHITFP